MNLFLPLLRPYQPIEVYRAWVKAALRCLFELDDPLRQLTGAGLRLYMECVWHCVRTERELALPGMTHGGAFRRCKLILEMLMAVSSVLADVEASDRTGCGALPRLPRSRNEETGSQYGLCQSAFLDVCSSTLERLAELL